MSERIRRTRQQWASLVRRYESGTQTAAQFCQEHGICEASLFRWKKTLQCAGRSSLAVAAEGPSTPDPRCGFVDLGPLDPTPGVLPAVEIRLDLGAGLTLTIRRS